VLRFGMAWQVAVVTMSDRAVLPYFWLLPLRDILGFSVWLAGYFGSTIVWRGNEFQLKNGKLERII
jgi:ceramide glucosyltransferase